MGQHFCNTFDITDSEVFYEENFGKAEKLIWSKWWDKSEAEAEH
jgi:hypothetical protein